MSSGWRSRGLHPEGKVTIARAFGTSLDIPDDPELLQRQQHEVDDVQLISPVEAVVGVAGMRMMVVMPAFPQIEERDHGVVPGGAGPSRRTLGRVRSEGMAEGVGRQRGVPCLRI